MQVIAYQCSCQEPRLSDLSYTIAHSPEIFYFLFFFIRIYRIHRIQTYPTLIYMPRTAQGWIQLVTFGYTSLEKTPYIGKLSNTFAWYKLLARHNEEDMAAVEKINGRQLTNRQKTFARHIVEGIYSNAECARKAGYSTDVASKQASVLLNGRDYPHVLEYVQELRTERERRYGVTTIGQLERLHQLSLGAEDAGQFSAAINAEKIRAALGGLTVDRREQINSIDQMSRDEITSRLAALQKQYPQAFVIDGTAKDITPDEQGTGGELLAIDQVEPAQELLRDED